MKGWLQDARKPCLTLDPEPLLPEAALQIEDLSPTSQEFLRFLSTRLHSNFLFSPQGLGSVLFGAQTRPTPDPPLLYVCFPESQGVGRASEESVLKAAQCKGG